MSLIGLPVVAVATLLGARGMHRTRVPLFVFVFTALAAVGPLAAVGGFL